MVLLLDARGVGNLAAAGVKGEEEEEDGLGRLGRGLGRAVAVLCVCAYV